MSNQSQGARQKRILITLAICVAAILLATIMGSYIQTAGWRYTVEDLRNASNSGKITLTTEDDTKEQQKVDENGQPVVGADGKPVMEEVPDIQTKEYTVSGKVVSGILFRPKKAEDGSRPAVVFSHGLYNNREMQLQNAIEMVRRGYVVIVMDQQNHGHSLSSNRQFDGTDHLDCAKYLYNLPEVDKTKIAVSGHSMGGSSTNQVLSKDGMAVGKRTDANFKSGLNMGIVSAYLVQANTPSSSIADNVIAYGVVKANADEFFYGNCTLKDYTYILKNHGSVSESAYASEITVNGEKVARYYIKQGKDYVPAASKPWSENRKYYEYTNKGTSNNYLQSSDAYNFTRALGLSSRSNPTLADYMKDIDDWTTVNGGIYAGGKLVAEPNGRKLVSVARKGEALTSEGQLRVVYEAKETHPMNHFSTKSAAHAIDFFYNAFGVTEGFNYKAPTNQTWWIKEAFAALGILGLFGMLLPILDLLLQSKLFASLKGEPAEAPVLLTRPRKHVSYWLAGIATTIFGAVAFHNLVDGGKWYSALGLNKVLDNTAEGFIYTNVGKMAAWGLMCAAFALIVTAIIWFVNHVINVIKYGDEATAHDEAPFAGFEIRSLGNIVKTLAVAAILIAVFYSTVTFIWKETCVQMQVWVFGPRVFELVRIASMAKYIPYFFGYYLVMAALAQGYRVKDLPEWATIAINVFFNVAGFMILVWHANSYYINNGSMIHTTLGGSSMGNPMHYIHAFPMVPSIAIATVMARRIYVRTGNAWLAGLVNASLMTIIACANTSIGAAPAWEYPAA